MIVACCCFKAKSEMDYVPEQTIKKTIPIDQKSTEDQINNDTENPGNLDALEVEENGLKADNSKNETKSPQKSSIKKSNKKPSNDGHCVIYGKSICVNGSNNGVLSTCSLSHHWYVDFISFHVSSIRFSNTMVIDNVSEKFHLMKIVSKDKNTYVNITKEDNEIHRLSLNIFYDSSVKIAIDNEDVYAELDGDSLTFVFALNDKIIVKELATKGRIKIMDLDSDFISFESLIRAESASGSLIDNTGKLFNCISGKSPIVIVDCSC